jgi:hypothetical protein
MDKDERYNARKHSERRNMITISIVAALFFICSIVIFATKYRNADGEWFAVAADENSKNGNNTEIETSDIDITETTTAEEKVDITEVNTENDTEAITEAESDDSTTEATTEVTTEAVTEAEPVDISEYVNITDPDLSS